MLLNFWSPAIIPAYYSETSTTLCLNVFMIIFANYFSRLKVPADEEDDDDANADVNDEERHISTPINHNAKRKTSNVHQAAPVVPPLIVPDASTSVNGNIQSTKTRSSTPVTSQILIEDQPGTSSLSLRNQVPGDRSNDHTPVASSAVNERCLNRSANSSFSQLPISDNGQSSRCETEETDKTANVSLNRAWQVFSKETFTVFAEIKSICCEIKSQVQQNTQVLQGMAQGKEEFAGRIDIFEELELPVNDKKELHKLNSKLKESDSHFNRMVSVI